MVHAGFPQSLDPQFPAGLPWPLNPRPPPPLYSLQPDQLLLAHKPLRLRARSRIHVIAICLAPLASYAATLAGRIKQYNGGARDGFAGCSTPLSQLDCPIPSLQAGPSGEGLRAARVCQGHPEITSEEARGVHAMSGEAFSNRHIYWQVHQLQAFFSQPCAYTQPGIGIRRGEPCATTSRCLPPGRLAHALLLLLPPDLYSAKANTSRPLHHQLHSALAAACSCPSAAIGKDRPQSSAAPLPCLA